MPKLRHDPSRTGFRRNNSNSSSYHENYLYIYLLLAETFKPFMSLVTF